MRNSSELIVGSDRYMVTHYSATVAGELFIELQKKIGGAIVAALVGADQESKVDAGLVAEMIQKAVPNFARGEFTRLAREIFSGALTFTETGQNVQLNDVYDIHFQGRIAHLYKVLAAVLKFQFSDFLGEAAESTAEIPVATPQMPKRPPIKAV